VNFAAKDNAAYVAGVVFARPGSAPSVWHQRKKKEDQVPGRNRRAAGEEVVGGLRS